MQGPLAAWVEHEAAWTATAHLMLGAPLDLYAPHEYCSIYWYCDFLLGAGQHAYNEFEQLKPAPAQKGPQLKRAGKGKAPPKPTAGEIELNERRSARVRPLVLCCNVAMLHIISSTC